MGFLLAFFIVIILIVFIFIGSVIKILRAVLGIGKKRTNFSQHNKEPQTYRTTSKKKKIFEKSEGEYVDFEEVK